MTGIFEAFKDFVSPLVNNEKHPLHVGEVTNLWVLLTMLEEGVTLYDIALNTSTDDQLTHILQNGKDLSEISIKKLSDFLKQEGIPLPKPSTQKPNSDPNSVPMGAKFTDEEISNLISVKLAAQITLIGQALAMSVRNDVGLKLFGTLYEMLKFGASLKNMLRQRGWLKVPPYYIPPGAP